MDNFSAVKIRDLRASLEGRSYSRAKLSTILSSQMPAQVSLSCPDGFVPDLRVRITPPDGNRVTVSAASFVSGRTVSLSANLYEACVNGADPATGEIQSGVYTVDLYTWNEKALIGSFEFIVR